MYRGYQTSHIIVFKQCVVQNYTERDGQIFGQFGPALREVKDAIFINEEEKSTSFIKRLEERVRFLWDMEIFSDSFLVLSVSVGSYSHKIYIDHSLKNAPAALDWAQRSSGDLEVSFQWIKNKVSTDQSKSYPRHRDQNYLFGSVKILRHSILEAAAPTESVTAQDDEDLRQGKRGQVGSTQDSSESKVTGTPDSSEPIPSSETLPKPSSLTGKDVSEPPKRSSLDEKDVSEPPKRSSLDEKDVSEPPKRSSLDEKDVYTPPDGKLPLYSELPSLGWESRKSSDKEAVSDNVEPLGQSSGVSLMPERNRNALERPPKKHRCRMQ